MCDNCKDIEQGKLYSAEQYLSCCKYVQKLADGGGFVFVHSTCNIGDVKENGCWADDVITHIIKCRNCGQMFILYADTYHGSASFEAENDKKEISKYINPQKGDRLKPWFINKFLNRGNKNV